MEDRLTCYTRFQLIVVFRCHHIRHLKYIALLTKMSYRVVYSIGNRKTKQQKPTLSFCLVFCSFHTRIIATIIPIVASPQMSKVQNDIIGKHNIVYKYSPFSILNLNPFFQQGL